MTTACDAWTEPVTNLVTLEPQRFQNEFMRWLGFGTAPPDLISLFLHETTHHWCFHSIVGHTITLLSLRARRRLMAAVLAHARAEEEGPPPGTRIDADSIHLMQPLLDAMAADLALVDDLHRIESASIMLRPLAEGLATFAEFDVSSKMSSKLLSTPLELATMLFVDPRGWVGAPDPAKRQILADIARHDMIRSLREGPIALERKLNVLARPFSADERGYLNGYLAVKSLWRTLSAGNLRAANETDLSLCYLRSFVYGDLGLVRCLLAPGKGEEVASAVVQHIHDRLWRLGDVSVGDFNAFEEASLSGSLPAPGQIDGDVTGLLLDGELVEECQALLDELAREVFDETGDVGALLGRASLDTVAIRQFLNLGEAAVELRADGPGFVKVIRNGAPVLQVAMRPGVSVTDGPGWLELLLTVTGPPRRIVVVGQEHGIVASGLIGGRADEELLNFISSVHLPRATLLDLEAGLPAARDEHLREHGMYDHLAENRVRMVDFADTVYRDIALRFSFEPGGRRRSHDNVDMTALKLQQVGLFALGPGGRMLSMKEARGMALLGMLCSIAPRRSYLDPMFSKAGLAVDETIACMVAAHAEHGFPPVPLVVEDSVYSVL